MIKFVQMKKFLEILILVFFINNAIVEPNKESKFAYLGIEKY